MCLGDKKLWHWVSHMCLGDKKLWHWVVPQLQVQLLVTAQGAALSWMEPWHEETAEWSVRMGIQEKQGIERTGNLGGGG